MTSKRGYAPKGYKAALDVEFDDLGNFKEEELKVVEKENILKHIKDIYWHSIP